MARATTPHSSGEPSILFRQADGHATARQLKRPITGFAVIEPMAPSSGDAAARHFFHTGRAACARAASAVSASSVASLS